MRLDRLASHLDFLWRFARRMGVAPAQADDVVQEAFVIAAHRLDRIEAEKERAYLTSVVMNLVRRERARRVHVPLDDDTSEDASRPDRILEEKRARAVLDASLAELDDSLRAVFVLHEIEQETMASIASLLELPTGTVASRLRRAREAWTAAVARREAKGAGR